MAGDRIAGEARAICDPDNLQAEFAIQVASDWQRRGLGGQLMDKLLAYLRGHNTREVFGLCLQENVGMVKLARSRGFDVTAGDEGTMRMRLVLRQEPPRAVAAAPTQATPP